MDGKVPMLNDFAMIGLALKILPEECEDPYLALLIQLRLISLYETLILKSDWPVAGY